MAGPGRHTSPPWRRRHSAGRRHRPCWLFSRIRPLHHAADIGDVVEIAQMVLQAAQLLQIARHLLLGIERGKNSAGVAQLLERDAQPVQIAFLRLDRACLPRFFTRATWRSSMRSAVRGRRWSRRQRQLREASAATSSAKQFEIGAGDAGADAAPRPRRGRFRRGRATGAGHRARPDLGGSASSLPTNTSRSRAGASRPVRILARPRNSSSQSWPNSRPKAPSATSSRRNATRN